MNNIKYLKHSLLAAMAIIATASAPAASADVGVSVTVGQPGFYGRIDIGDYPYPQPRLIYHEPVIIHRSVGVIHEPIYLRVPPGHARKWRHYCGRYNACGQPAYFVQDRWYNEVYVPHYRERHGGNEWYGHDNGGRGRGYGHDNRGRGRDHGHGRGHGRGRN